MSTEATKPTPQMGLFQQPARRVSLSHRLRQLILFRVALLTTFFAAALAIDWTFGPPSTFSGPFGHFLMLLTGALYLLSFAYWVALPHTKDLETFGLAQIAADLAFTTLLAHATGGALSGFAFLYPLSTLTAALLFYDRGALLTSLAGSSLFGMISIAGYAGLLPPLSGQLLFPWEATAAEIARLVATNTAACFAVGVLGSILASELRTARAEVAAQEVFIRDLSRLNDAIIRSLPNGLISIDQEGIIRTANQAAHNILGYSGESLLSCRLADVAPEFDTIGSSPTSHGLTDNVDRVEVSVARADGTRIPIGVSVAPLREPQVGTVGRVIAFRDLTPIRRMEEAVQRAEHLAGIGRLAASVAHELRNPLASISGSIELLRNVQELAGEDRQLMDIVLREVQRLSGLVDGLLQYARPQSPHRVPINLADLVADVVRMFREEAQSSRITVSAVAPPVLQVEADASQIRQVLWNLLRNAAEASPKDGVIEVALEKMGDRASLAVRDQGPGIPQGACERLFEPFFTTKERGAGLGLAITRRIVEAHGGTIEVEFLGESGQGAMFTVLLPALLTD